MATKARTALTLTGLMLLAPSALLPVKRLDAATAELSGDRVHDEIAVAEVARRGDSVTGMLVNRSGAEIRDIRLLIDMPFLWADETNPGDDSPARSAILTVAGPLVPRGKLAFEFRPNPPLPKRTDGRFADPQVRVLGYQTITMP